MNAFVTVASILCLSVVCTAQQQPAPNDTMNQLSKSAEQELAGSIQELTKLREQIAAEKLPLAQELTSLEEKLSQLRRDYDKVARMVDEGNLQISSIKSEMKARQDELTYVGSLLDDYARTFESKINVSELQYCGEAIDTAKQATENTTLSMPEKFTRQTSLVNVSLKRLFDSIGGMRFPGVGVDLQGAVASGQFALIGPVALFRGSGANSAATGLVVPQSGSTKPLIRPLEGAMQTGIAQLIDTGNGTMPLDPSRGGALKALVQRTNLVHIFKKGGPVMYPLLIASILALGTVLERVLFLMREKWRRSPKAQEKFFAAVAKSDIAAAIEIGKTSKFYVVRALGYALAHRETSLESAILYAQAQELKRFRRGIPILDTVITLAPLLGLLGTVTGMMGSFSLIGGELSSPGAITGGIAEALIATAFGLGIAITALLPFNFLNTKMEVARHELESAATQLELLVKPTTMAAGNAVAATIQAEPNGRSQSIAGPDDDQRRRRELQRKRLALQRQIVQLQNELDEQDLEIVSTASLEPPIVEKV